MAKFSERHNLQGSGGTSFTQRRSLGITPTMPTRQTPVKQSQTEELYRRADAAAAPDVGKYLQDYYNALDTHYNNVVSNGGEKVAKHNGIAESSRALEEYQRQSGDIINTIRNAYGADETLIGAVRDLNRSYAQLDNAVYNSASQRARQEIADIGNNATAAQRATSRANRGERLTLEDISALDTQISNELGITQNAPQSEGFVVNPLSGRSGILEAARQIRDEDDRTPLDRMNGETLDASGMTDQTIPGFQTVDERFGNSDVTRDISISNLPLVAAESGIRSEAELSMTPEEMDNARSLFATMDSVYRNENATNDELNFQSDIARGIARNSSNSEAIQNMAQEYYQLLQNRISETSGAEYLTNRFTDAFVDWRNNYDTLASQGLGDIATGGSFSEGYKKLTDFAASHPATYRRAMEEHFGEGQNSGMRRELAEAAGVTVAVVDSWLKANEASYLELRADERASGLSDEFKKYIGDTVYHTASQIPTWVLSAALGGWGVASSMPGSVVEGLATGIQNARQATSFAGAARAFGTSFGQGLLAAAKADPALWFSFGIGTMGRTAAQNAMQRGSDPANYLNAALMGFSEVFSENFSGFGSAKNPFTSLTSPKGSRFLSALTAIGNYMLSGAEEGLEEVINVPLQNYFNALTFGGNGKLVGTGGIFDFAEMWEAGVSGAAMGAILGSVGTFSNIATNLLADASTTESSAYIRDVANNILNSPENLILSDGTALDRLNPNTADRQAILDRIGTLLADKRDIVLKAVGESHIRDESLDELYSTADRLGADVQVLVEQARAQGSAVEPKLVGEIAVAVNGVEAESESAAQTIRPVAYQQALQDLVDYRDKLEVAYQEPESEAPTTTAELAGGSLSPAARAQVNAMYDTYQANMDAEDDRRRAAAGDAAFTPVERMSEKQFADAYTLAYSSGKMYYGLNENQRTAMRNDAVRESGADWAGDAFDLGVSEVRALEAARVLPGRDKGGLRSATVGELSKFMQSSWADTVDINDTNGLTDREKKDIAAIKYLANALGVDIAVYRSRSNKADNGFLDRKTGTIYIDIQAGEGNDRSALRTLSHELTHWMQLKADTQYAELKNYIINRYFNGSEKAFNDRVRSYTEVREEDRVDELIADHCEMMLRDTEVIRDIYENHRSLFDKIVDFIKNVVDSIRSAMEGVGNYSEASTDFADDLEYWEGVQRLWDAGILAASERKVTAIMDTGISDETAVDMVENGLTVEKGAIVSEDVAKVMASDEFQPPVDDNEVQSSPRTTPAWEKAFRKRYTNLTAEQQDEIIDAIYAFNEDGVMQAAVGFAADSDPAGFFANSKFGPLRTNVEYKYTFDMDTSCPRTFQFLAYRDKIQRNLGRPLTYWESQNLLNVMRVTGQNIPCTYCYVENKRILLSESFNNYFTYRASVMEAATDEEARTKMYGYDSTKDELTKASQKVFSEWRKDTSYHPSAAQCYSAAQQSRNLINKVLDSAWQNGELRRNASLTSIRDFVANRYGLKDKNALAQVKSIVAEWKYDVDARREHMVDIEGVAETVDEQALSVLNHAMAYAKSASSAKKVENYMPYTGQLGNIPASVKAYIQAMGGLRKHSSNDFRVDYVQDYFLLFADMAAGGWMGHTYTKSVDYVKIFGRTGDRINMSIALNGETYDTITENSQEGMAWKDAKELREAYKDNAGVMCMVTNDAQLAWALDQDWIDMIIPFRASGLYKEVWSDIRRWLDYTTKQNESFWTTEEMRQQLSSAGIDIEDDADIKALYYKALGKTALLEVDEDGNTKYHRPHFFPDDTKIELKTPDGKRTVTIPGHHNDPQRYLALCDQYGVRPRFYNAVIEHDGKMIRASEHPQFIKLIKETSRIDTEQTAIRFNFDEYDEYLGMSAFDYALKRMDEERKNGGFNNAKEDPYGIVDAFLDKKNGFVGAKKFVDPARVPRYKTMMDITENGMSDWESRDEDLVSNEYVQHSIRKTDDGTQFVYVQNSNIFGSDDISTGELRKRVKQYLKSHYQGQTLPAGDGDNLYITSQSIGEYGSSRGKLSDAEYRGKQRAASEFAELLSASFARRWRPDNGRHPDATRGWHYYSVIFALPVRGDIRVYEGVVNVKLTDTQDVFHDIRDVRDITRGKAVNAPGHINGASVIRSLAIVNLGQRRITNDNISQRDTDVNPSSSELQRSSRRNRLSAIDVVTAMQNYEGMSSDLANAAKQVKQLYASYNSYTNDIQKLDRQINEATGKERRNLEYKRRTAAQKRSSVADKIDSVMEQSGLREYAEGERAGIMDLFEENFRSGVRYINAAYNIPAENTIAREQLNTEAANQRAERLREQGDERYARNDTEWRERYERLRRRYDTTKLQMWWEQAEMRRDFKAYVAARNEREAAKTLRNTIRNRVDRLSAMLTTNTDRLHVVNELQHPVAQFLSLIDPSKQGNSKTAQASAAAWSKTLSALLDIANRDDGTTDNIVLANFADEIKALRNMTETLASENPGAVFVLDNMNSEQLLKLNRVVRAIQALVNSTNRVFTNRRYQTVQQMVDASDEELRAIKGRATLLPESSKLSKEELALQRSLAWNNGTPYYVFKRFQGVGQSLYDSVAEGWGQLAKNAQVCIDFAKNTWTDREASSWTKDKQKVEFTDVKGDTHTVYMTTSQLMALWCHNQQNQSKIHLFGRGFKIGVADAIPNQERFYKITQDTLDQILTSKENGGSYLTDRQISVASAIMNFMTVEGARLGNAVTRQLFGFDYFDATQPYFTIHAADTEFNREPSDRQPSLFSLLHMSATRKRTENANSALVIDDIFTVFSSHMADMCKYNALALPMLDMVNWRNGRTSGDYENSRKITQDLAEVFGTNLAQNYVDQFIRDMNGTYSSGDLIAKRFDKLLSKMKRAAVAASLRVVVQQPFSYVRAMYSISPKYLLKALAPTLDLKKNIAEAKEHSGLALSKAQGYFSTNIAKSLQEQIANNSTWRDVLVDKAMSLAGAADQITWGTIWKAAKYKVENEGYDGKFFKKGSDEYFNAVTKVFDQIVLSTQVMDGTLTRSPYMRDDKMYTKIFTMFMAEPTLSYNIVLDSFSEWKLASRKGTGTKAAKRKVALAIATYALTQIANALVTALIDAFRDDDDYESFWEKYLQHAEANLVANANPLEGIPTANGLWKVIQAAWGNTKSPLGSEFQGITQTVRSIRAAYDAIRNEKTEANYYGKMTPWGVVSGLMSGMSYLTGLPIANASKVITSTYNTIATIWNDVFGRESGKYLEHWKTFDSNTSGYDGLYQALLRNDENRVETLMLELMAGGIAEDAIAKEIRSRVRSSYLDSSISEEKAIAILEEFGYDADERKKLLNDWRFRRDFGVDDPSSAMANHYYNTFKPLGLDPQRFAEYYRGITQATKTDNMTRAEVIRDYISRLQVSESVKSALWHIEYSSEW